MTTHHVVEAPKLTQPLENPPLSSVAKIVELRGKKSHHRHVCNEWNPPPFQSRYRDHLAL